MAYKIVLFNHKGGVSKTTTSYNLGWMLSKLGHKTLLVDADPQCNLTALILGDQFDQYYYDDVTKLNNIKNGVAPAFEAKAETIKAIACPNPDRNPNLFLIPGHADLSEYETALSFAQTSNNALVTLQNLPGAFNALINLTADSINAEYVIIDLNPGLSAINQNLFSLCDAFIVPTNPDPFSVMALDTLGKILPKWVSWSHQMRNTFNESAYPLPDTTPKFIGGIIQRFNIRKGKAAGPYRDNINDIKNKFSKQFTSHITKSHMLFPSESYKKADIEPDYCLVEIPDFAGLLPKSNSAGVPVFDLTDADINEQGAVLDGLKRKKNEIESMFITLAKKIIKLKESSLES